MSGFTSVLIGNESLLVQCGELLLARGGKIARVVTRNDEIADWARRQEIEVVAPGKGLASRLAGSEFDWLFSIANLDMLPADVLALPARGAVNFHDGPLPAYAGLNAPVWALMAGETRFGITWHMITEGADKGDIVAQEVFDIAADETALTLNTKCYSAGLSAFERVLDGAMAGEMPRVVQNLSGRSYFARDKRPPAFGRLDFTQPAEVLARAVRALDHGSYWNPLTLAKFTAAGEVFLVTRAAVEPAQNATPGTVLDIRADKLLVATGDGALLLDGLKRADGQVVEVVDFTAVGEVLPSPEREESAALDQLASSLAPNDSFWRQQLAAMRPATLALAENGTGEVMTQSLALPRGLTNPLAALAGFALRLAEAEQADFAYAGAALPPMASPGYASPWVPLGFDAGAGDFAAAAQAFTTAQQAAEAHGTFAMDLAARAPEIATLKTPDIGLGNSGAGLIPGTALTLALDGEQAVLHADSGRIDAAYLDLLAARLALFLDEVARDPARPLTAINWLPEAERDFVLKTVNDTATPLSGPALIHRAFEAQVARTPDAIAVVFEGESVTYDALNRAANRAAHVLAEMGVRPGQPVALHVNRGINMLIGALAILKAGGAYVPLDPAFPAERLAHYLADSKAEVLVSEASLAGTLPDSAIKRLDLDADKRLSGAADSNPDADVSATDLAYVIYTSGSTGTPKGVMVEHGNVANFFTGMDAVIKPDADKPGTWLAVTSLSFDISVLELFWTLARGFKLVVGGDTPQTPLAGSSTLHHSDRHMDFSIFYWGNDDGPGPQKYQMLLDGARFADENGFVAVWTPERHFHAFGGPYPNPAITGAAVAAVTKNIGVRSGSVVAPLHHPARIAEEWAVIDNLTNGGAGLGIAAGWQPHDFVLRPENTPPANKPAMFEAIETVRKLWRGEEVEFPLADGTKHAVMTQPRPVSRELPIWVTTAGNPDTWREAGEIGANVLTHLLGQSIAEVGDKIEIYHDALRGAGHDPADFTVTLMLHTYLAETREQAREEARGPMKDYLRSAAGLIKQFAWVFPAFKRPKGVSNAFELNLDALTGDELEEILDFAFLRYFEDSGLFGTVDDALARVEQLKAIGVDEVACLVDYGIEPAKVLAGLRPLAKVVARANQQVVLAEDDFSLAAQIRRHQVTHMQMTPSMARMITHNDGARGALAQLSHLHVGGEALPGPRVRDLARATPAHITNMYGPTETTIWSATEPAQPCEGTVNIGRPIANTALYVLDESGAPLPIGVAGELWIGGAGVARGYLGRDGLTEAAFRPDPFTGTGRIYRTGDLVRRRPDGRLDFIGRADGQVKLRGFRIELGEIEARLAAALGAGAQVVVLLREDQEGDARLVAYVTGATLHEKALRAALAKSLPAYMVPAHFVALDSFPLTPNKKIDRKALPAPAEVTTQAAASQDFAAPSGEAEAKIAEIWSRILGVARIGARDNFFELGGHSLLAVQAHREIKAALGAEDLSITDIFRFPTLEAIAERVTGATNAPDPAPQEGASSRAGARAEAMAKRRAMRAGRRRG